MYVTHDQVEAMTMCDRVGLMRDGRLVQLDTPQSLYERPADLFVAGFIGSPAMNVVRARLAASNGVVAAAFGSTTLELPARALPPSVLLERTGRDVILGFRPEDLEDASVAETNGHPLLHALVTLAEPVGGEVIVHFDVGGLESSGLRACLSSRCAARPDEPLALAVDPAKLHFFDPETETALS